MHLAALLNIRKILSLKTFVFFLKVYRSSIYNCYLRCHALLSLDAVNWKRMLMSALHTACSSLTWRQLILHQCSFDLILTHQQPRCGYWSWQDNCCQSTVLLVCEQGPHTLVVVVSWQLEYFCLSIPSFYCGHHRKQAVLFYTGGFLDDKLFSLASETAAATSIGCLGCPALLSFGVDDWKVALPHYIHCLIHPPQERLHNRFRCQ